MLPTLLTETVLTFSQAAASLPEIGGKRPSAKTVYAWCDTGVNVGAGRVRLECAKVGGKRVTSREALARFIAATSRGEEPEPPRTPHERHRASEAALKFLRAEFAKV